MRINLFGTPEQKALVQCRSDYIFLAAGRRWGKNFGLRNRHLSRVLGRRRFQYLHAAPSYAQVQSEWEHLTGHPGLKRLIKKASKKDPYPRIHWLNGSESHFRSLDT